MHIKAWGADPETSRVYAKRCGLGAPSLVPSSAVLTQCTTYLRAEYALTAMISFYYMAFYGLDV